MSLVTMDVPQIRFVDPDLFPTKVDYVNAVLLAQREQYQAQKPLRDAYRNEHSTSTSVSSCMDSRCEFSNLTNTPDGLVQQWRNIGGKFEFGWSYFGSKFNRWVKYGQAHQKDSLFIATYHFSEGSKERGCRGFKNNKERALRSAEHLRRESKRLAKTKSFSAFTWGIETDTDALILHGEGDQVVNLARDISTHASDSEVYDLLNNLYPSAPERVKYDVAPFIRRNLQHIAEIKSSLRPIENADHKEWMLVVGHGFHFHLPNTALIVGPWDPDMSGAITTAAKLLRDNVEAGRINLKNGLLLVSCWPCGHCKKQQHLAKKRVLYHQELTHKITTKKFPEIADHLEELALVTTFDTREPMVINRTPL